MTRYQTIIYVEGRDNDPVFYAAIAERYQQETGRATDVRIADELPNSAVQALGGSGGKKVLERAATFLERWRNRSNGRLLRGKEIAFCADKDIDDLLGKSSQCPAMIYTRFHSVENHLVQRCDLHNAICCAISASPGVVQREFGDCNQMRNLACRWREWVIYCVLSLQLGITRSGNYGQESPFNNPPHAAPDNAKVAGAFRVAKQAYGNDSAFDLKERAVTQLVDRLIREDRFDEVFKGKWYGSILFHVLESHNAFRAGTRTCGKIGLWIAIRSSFSLDEGDYSYYADRFAQLG